MKEVIRQRAEELGFDACRFTTATPPASASKFEEWLAEGNQGEMSYLARNSQKRVDPRQVLDEALSVVALAVSYHRESARNFSSPPAPKNGVIARYARYDDYHSILGKRLAVLAQFIETLGGPGTRSLWYVDTGPVLERDLAQRAGLGFIGKHTNLISRELGNWIFLGEIITTLGLEPDASERNHCGSCTRCISACPTQAIKAPFKLDARRCISYLTIELKGPIPLELRPAIGNRIYGCDDCLAACPWNRFAREGRMLRPHVRPTLATPDLIELLSIDETEFKRRFAGTSLQRTKRRGLLRNVCVALGNTGDSSAIPALQRASKDPEPLIVEHASWALEQVLNRSDRNSSD